MGLNLLEVRKGNYYKLFGNLRLDDETGQMDNEYVPEDPFWMYDQITGDLAFNVYLDRVRYSPIQLTSKVLDRFIGTGDKRLWNINGHALYTIQQYRTWISFSDKKIDQIFICGLNIPIDRCRYLHQLQNLYYDLMGAPLPIQVDLSKLNWYDNVPEKDSIED